YPNPERSHFESMDIWQSADAHRMVTTGWLGRAACACDDHSGGVPILHIGSSRQPLAVAGAPGSGAVSIRDQNSFHLQLAHGPPGRQKPRRRLLEELAVPAAKGDGDDLVSFVQRRQVQTLTAVESLRQLLEGRDAVPQQGNGLALKLQLIAGLIAKGFGTRIF